MGETDHQLCKEFQQTPEQILEAVKLTPEMVKGKSVLYFGSEPLSVNEASIIPGSLEAFLALDRLLPNGKFVDFVLGINDDYLDGNIEDVDRLDLLEAAIVSLNDSGEVRIADPYFPNTVGETAGAIEAIYEHALYDRDRDIQASFEPRTHDQKSLLILKKVITNRQ